MKKTLSAIFVIAFILTICVLSTFATLSYRVSVIYYPPNDVKVESKIDVQGGDTPYYMEVWIRSDNTTDEEKFNCGIVTGGDASLTSGIITISYPGATIPLVEYGGEARELTQID